MNNATTSKPDIYETSPSMLDRWAKSFVFKMMDKLKYGRITIQDGETQRVFGSEPNLSAHLTVRNPRFYKKVLFGGSVGAGEAYIDQLWEVDELTTLVRIMVRNMELLDGMDNGFARLVYPFRRVGHFLNRNNKKGARRNILSHYDLGNEMYQTFLDPSMMYSSAIYTNEHTTLEAASQHKLDTICEKLDLQSSDRVIEIGAGWCGFAIYAAAKYGCHITTTTISRAQYREGKRRIAQAGLTGKITLLRKDYRDLTGQYDKLVSIEMIEAVGHDYHADFFKTCGNLLKRDGKMLIQAITIADQKYDHYVHAVDFLQRHIFPGGCVPSVQRMVEVLVDQTDMVVRGLEDFGPAYARTLEAWRRRFNRAYPNLNKRGYDRFFKRLWNFYLCYCEGGFIERAISVVHLVATRPGHR